MARIGIIESSLSVDVDENRLAGDNPCGGISTSVMECYPRGQPEAGLHYFVI
jgi:hypothetical protein